MKRFVSLFGLLYLLSAVLFSQEHSKSTFRSYQPGYYENSILKDNRELDQQKAPREMVKRFQVDLAGIDLPNKLSLYKNQVWYNPPLSQGNTGTCWCFSTTSFYESEIYRLTGQKIKLSEIYTVYWEYVEKAKYFVQQRGKSLFDQGSEGNAVARIWRKYGAVPEDVYTGLIDGRKFHNHEAMFNEMKSYLTSVQTANAWNEEEVIGTIKSIMNHYLGEPPATFIWNGKNYSPMQFFKDVMKLNLDDYVDIVSYKQELFWQQVEYKVPDNWWHSKDYYNMPVADYMTVLKNAIRKGYSMAIGGDVSEAGFDRETQCAMIPTFDIPSAYIDDDARQFRFSNHSTTDDHGLHLVGYLQKNGKDWYLVKDSGSGSRNNNEKAPEFGFYFFSEDYVMLKIMDFTVHKDAVKDLLGKFGK